MIADAHRRAALLAALAVAPCHRLPLRAMRLQLELLGYSPSIDRLRTDLAWCEEQGLISQAGDVATLTERGSDVAQGRARMPGVGQPMPGGPR